jgi:hypothetical protein
MSFHAVRRFFHINGSVFYNNELKSNSVISREGSFAVPISPTEKKGYQFTGANIRVRDQDGGEALRVNVEAGFKPAPPLHPHWARHAGGWNPGDLS